MASPKPYRTFTVGFEGFREDFVAGSGEGDVDRQGLLAALKTYLEARHQRADWSAISKSSTESLVNMLALAGIRVQLRSRNRHRAFADCSI